MENTVQLALISGFLELERMNMAYNGAEIQKTDEGMCLCFYPVGPLSLLVDESHVGHIYNFYQTFREGEVWVKTLSV